MAISVSSVRRHWPLVAVLVVLVVLLGLLASRLQWVEEEVDLGPTTEALHNPFLASQRLLEQYGVDYVMHNGLRALQEQKQASLGLSDTLILISAFQSLQAQQVESLWQWVEAGGRLIVGLENPAVGTGAHLQDPLLARMDLVLHPGPQFYLHLHGNSEAEQPEDASPASEDAPAASAPADATELACSSGLPTVATQLKEHEPQLSLSVSGNTILRGGDQQTQILAGDDQGAFFVRREVGAGEIYLITSAEAWRNSHIGCADNAYIFWRLTGDSAKVWYAVNLQSPSLWQYLWQLSPVGCLALLLALVAWLCTRSTRFGPVFAEANTRQRRFAEHLDASAQFFLHQGGNSALLEVLRSDITQRAERRHPGFSHLPRADKIHILRSLSGIDAELIDTALFDDQTPSAVQFLEVVKRLQQLRNQL